MKFSVIIAAHNEGPQIASALKRLRQISKTSPMEVLLVDGGSDDGTAQAAGDWADQILELTAASRGAQWHAGAEKATGDVLFFLRADVQPPGNWQQALEHFWLTTAVEKIAGVGFSVDYGATAGLRLLSAWSNARARGGILGADHGICTTPELYKSSGGFPAYAELEDYEFSRRLGKLGRIQLLKERVHAAARRVRAQGPLGYAARRLWAETRYRMGSAA